MSRKQLFDEAKAAEITYPHRVENSIEMVAFMLHYSGVKSFRDPVDVLTSFIKSRVADPSVSRHDSTHTRHGEAAFPSLRNIAFQRVDFRVYQHCVGNVLGVRISRVILNTEYYDPQTYSYLRCGKPCTIHMLHRVVHIQEKCI